MKAIAFLLSIFLMVAIGPAQACMVGQPKLDDLYQVFNSLFYEPGDTGRMGSDIELLNSGFYLPNGQDLQFGNPGDTLRIDLTFNDALFGNELGYMSGGQYHMLVEDQYARSNRYHPFRSNFNNGRYAGHRDQRGDRPFHRPEDATFTVAEDFMIADTVSVFGFPMQRWYADAQLNPFGQKDHFLAFAIDDQSLLDNYNLLFETEYSVGLDEVWMIAFEGLNLGDADYTDLVAVVARPFELNPVAVPLPGAALLLLSGLVAVTGFRISRSMHRREYS